MSKLYVFTISLLFLLIPSASLAKEKSQITISAAASLKDIFTQALQDFKVLYPDVTVQLNFGGSGMLSQQIINGAPVDLFASADSLSMDQLQQRNLLKNDSRRDFALNSLVFVIPKDSTRKTFIYKSLRDISNDDTIKRIAIGNTDSVPAGRYAKSALMKEGIYEILSNRFIPTPNVRTALYYVVNGEVDGAFVYASDAQLERDKVDIAYKIYLDPPPTYPISILAASKNITTSQNFIDFLTSLRGKEILTQYGFSYPSDPRYNEEEGLCANIF